MKCSFLSMQWFYSWKELKGCQRIRRCVLPAEVLGGGGGRWEVGGGKWKVGGGRW